MTEQTFISRRERRAAREAAGRPAHNAGTAGRTAAAVLASAGLVIGTGVAASANDDATASEGRALSTVDINAAEFSIERTTAPAVSSVTASPEVDLTFERPAFSTESAPEPEPEPEPEPVEAEAAAQETEEPAESEPQQEAAPQQESQPEQSSQQESSSSSEGNNGGGESASSDDSGASEQSSEPAPSSGGSGSVVSAAYDGLGVPYLWGGTTTAGFDCSGFINWAYNRAGRGGLPRTTYGMEASLPRVSSPQPGDIVLANGSTHGGIYVGNGQVISATVSNGISVHDINAGWHNVNAILRPN